MSKTFFSSSILLLFTVILAPASTIYNNGPSNLSDGVNISSYVAADDFVVANSAQLQEITLYASSDSNPFPTFGQLDWFVLADNAGSPGQTIASGISAPSFIDTGNQILGTEEFEIDAQVTPFSLATGTFWLALAVDPSSNLTQNVYWDTTSQTHGASALVTTTLSSPSWSPAVSGADGTDLAFSLQGPSDDAPEASSFVLVLLSVPLLACLNKAIRGRS